MRGLAFDGERKSTVGSTVASLEVDQHALQLGGDGKPLLECDENESSYALALAAQAAAIAAGDDDGTQPSMLDGIIEGMTTPPPPDPTPLSKPASAATSSSAPLPTQPTASRAASSTTASPTTPPPPPSGSGQPPPPPKRSAPNPSPPTPTPIKPSKPPPGSFELVRAFREGKRKRSLVLRVWDTGGQPVFLSILQLLTAREGTVYLIVFNLAELHEAFDDAVDSIVAQLHSIQLYAAGAPVLLAGTRKDEVNGGSTATIRSLSARLHETLLRRCAPAIGGLKMCDGLCFFAVENKRGYGGDETIRQLVRAIDSAAHGLPAVQRRMPQAWLRVHDELRRIGGTRRKINLDEAREICLSHGLLMRAHDRARAARAPHLPPLARLPFMVRHRSAAIARGARPAVDCRRGHMRHPRL